MKLSESQTEALMAIYEGDNSALEEIRGNTEASLVRRGLIEISVEDLGPEYGDIEYLILTQKGAAALYGMELIPEPDLALRLRPPTLTTTEVVASEDDAPWTKTPWG